MPCSSMFIDSGAFSLGPLVDKGKLVGDTVKVNGKIKQLSWYDSTGYWEYIDSYCNFVKEHKDCVDVFVNVDVLDDPKKTYRNQKYIEDKHGLRPVPVIHSFTEDKWIDKYIEEGHDYIALGGMGGRQMHKRKQYKKWIDRVFTRLCPASNNYLPIVKTHGFAVTSWHTMMRYPWWSVDSTTYAKMGGYGWMLIPRMKTSPGKRHEFDYTREYLQIGVCTEPSPGVKAKPNTRKLWDYYDGQYVSPHAAKAVGIPKGPSGRQLAGNVFKHIGPVNRRNKQVFNHLLRWLEFVDLPLGDDEAGIPGVVNRPDYRIRSNIIYFDELQRHMTPWPWPFRKSGGFGLI